MSFGSVSGIMPGSARGACMAANEVIRIESKSCLNMATLIIGRNYPSLNLFQRQSLFSIRIIHDFAFIVEHHRRAILQRERRPIGQVRMIRISVASEGGPRRA